MLSYGPDALVGLRPNDIGAAFLEKKKKMQKSLCARV